MIWTMPLRVAQVVYALFILVPAATYWHPLAPDQQVYVLAVVVGLLVFPFVPDRLLRKRVMKAGFVALTLASIAAHMVQIYNDLFLLNGADIFPAVVRSVGVALLCAGWLRLKKQ